MNNSDQSNSQNPLIHKNRKIKVEDNNGNSEEYFLGVCEEITPLEDRFLSIKRYEVKIFDCGHAGYLVNFIGGRCSKCRKTVCISCLERCSKDNKVFCLECLRENNGTYLCKKHARIHLVLLLFVGLFNLIKSILSALFELPLKIFEENK